MPRKNIRRAAAIADDEFFDARADLIERAYKRAIEYLLMTGEGEGDKRFYADVAFHLVAEVREHQQLSFLRITNGAIQRYLSQRHSRFAA
ncbi:MAG TPA: hypothetical protein VHD34_02825 [Xanthobacteraceae bacterium]|nr:hypothetical protein [Xanthobacteraceae bacterium]